MKRRKLPENWDSLPVEEVLFGGVKKKIRYDEETNTVYMLDDRGEWTGEQAHPPVKKPSATTADSTSNEAPSTDNSENASEEEEVTPLVRRKKKKLGATPFLIGVIVILVIMLFAQKEPAISSGTSYEILVAIENIQPGESIFGKLGKETVSQEEFLQYSASGGIYTMSDYDSVKSYVATGFIPAGSTISYSNIGKEFVAANPWTIKTQYVTIELPISMQTDALSELLWGNVVTITVTATRSIGTEEYPNAYRPTSPEVSGSTTTTTYQTDTYVLKGVTISDVLNRDRTSLYSTYAAMAAIPDIYREDCINARYSSAAQISADTPAYICIPVTKETAKWWNQVNNKKHDITVTVQVTGADCETDFQYQTNLAMKNMVATLTSALTVEE